MGGGREGGSRMAADVLDGMRLLEATALLLKR